MDAFAAGGVGSFGGYGLGLLAGLFSTLSPCVLPILPIVVGSALSAHRWGAAALAAGLALSYLTIGMFAATIGFGIGLGGDVFRTAGAVLLGLLGVALLSGWVQRRFALLAGSVGTGALGRFNPTGLRGQFGLGALLGAVWSPCVGPTLGAAVALAAQRQNLAQVAGVMTLFAIGAAAPLLVVGSLSRSALTRWRGRMLSVGGFGKQALGIVMIGLAAFILSGADHGVEAALVGATPAWLSDLTTRF